MIIEELNGRIDELEAQLEHQTLLLDKIQKILSLHYETSTDNLDELIEIVCLILDIRPSDLKGRERLQKYVSGRQAISYVGSQILRFTVSEIGSRLNRDHSTIIHNRNAFSDFLDMGYQKENQLYESIIKELNVRGIHK